MAFQIIFLFHFVISTYYLTFKKNVYFRQKKIRQDYFFGVEKKRIPSFYKNMSQKKEILKNN